MRYKLYVPHCYKNHDRPLVVMLHGCRQTADDFACGTQMNNLADEWQCLVAYPEQSSSANEIRCWNWFQAAHQQRHRGEPAVIAGLTREIISQYRVNPRKVFVAGLSAGASMAVILGQTYPDVFAAVGSHSGLAYESARNLLSGLGVMRRGASLSRMSLIGRQRVPTIVFQGDMDETVHPKNSDIIVAQVVRAASWIDGKRVQLRHKVLTYKGNASNRDFTRKVHLDSLGKPFVEHWVVHGAGHAWSGGNGAGSYTDTAGPNAGLEMLRFFMSVSQAGGVAVASPMNTVEPLS